MYLLHHLDLYVDLYIWKNRAFRKVRELLSCDSQDAHPSIRNKLVQEGPVHLYTNCDNALLAIHPSVGPQFRLCLALRGFPCSFESWSVKLCIVIVHGILFEAHTLGW